MLLFIRIRFHHEPETARSVCFWIIESPEKAPPKAKKPRFDLQYDECEGSPTETVKSESINQLQDKRMKERRFCIDSGALDALAQSTQRSTCAYTFWASPSNLSI